MPLDELFSRHLQWFFAWNALSLLLGLISLRRSYQFTRSFGWMLLSWALANTLVWCWLINHIDPYPSPWLDWHKIHLREMMLLNLQLDLLYGVLALLLLLIGYLLKKNRLAWWGLAAGLIFQALGLFILDLQLFQALKI